MLEAVAAAAAVPVTAVRRAVTLTGDLAPVAAAALAGGAAELAALRLAVGRPLPPMLAQTAADLADGARADRPAAVEWKLDGVRVQVHRDGDDVARVHPHPGRRHRPPARGGGGGARRCPRAAPCSTAR